MPFLKFSRDRRGYEHFYVILEPVSGRPGNTRQRVLYWFRTPPNVKIGREPFDDQVMRSLEAQYPGIRFDWEALRNTPIPSVEPEYWRERRRAERAARLAQDEEEDIAPTAVVDPGPDTFSGDAVSGGGVEAGTRNSAGQRRGRRRRGRGPAVGRTPDQPGPTGRTSSSSVDSKDVQPVSPNDGPEDI